MKFSIFVLTFLILLFSFTFSQEIQKINLPGWELEGELIHHTPDDLWKYINGAAEQFLSYDFQKLQSGDYKSGSMGITIDIYDMGTPLNAFGIYNIEKPKNKKSLKIGTETILVPPYQMLILKDKFYIKCNLYDGEYNEDGIKQLMQKIASSLSGSEEFPKEFDLLPKNDQIKNSESYIKEGYQGLSELYNCISADYKGKNDKVFQYYLIYNKNNFSIEESWSNFSQKWKTFEVNKKSVLYKKIPYKGYIGLIQINNRIYGVINCNSMDILKQRFNKLLDELN